MNRLKIFEISIINIISQEEQENNKQSKIYSDYNIYTNNKVTKIVEEDEMVDFNDKKILNNRLSFIDSKNSIF